MKDGDVVPEPPEAASDEDSVSSPFEYAGERVH